jgi:hypothetical protein
MTKTLAVPLLALAFAGCTIHQTKSEDSGKTEKVDIRTPMGSLKVRSTDVDPKDTGLSVYPGAQRVTETGDNDTHSANVNIDTPVFQLKVVAVKFTSPDPPAKVLDYYRKEMKTFPGKFLECKGTGNMSDVNPDDSEKNKDLSCDSKNSGDGTDLKVGSPNKQRLVHVNPSGKGSEFTLLYLRAHGEQD